MMWEVGRKWARVDKKIIHCVYVYLSETVNYEEKLKLCEHFPKCKGIY